MLLLIYKCISSCPFTRWFSPNSPNVTIRLIIIRLLNVFSLVLCCVTCPLFGFLVRIHLNIYEFVNHIIVCSIAILSHWQNENKHIYMLNCMARSLDMTPIGPSQLCPHSAWHHSHSLCYPRPYGMLGFVHSFCLRGILLVLNSWWRPIRKVRCAI